MQLEKVIGTSSKDSYSIAINPVTGDIVYLAGCFVVVFSVRDAK